MKKTMTAALLSLTIAGTAISPAASVTAKTVSDAGVSHNGVVSAAAEIPKEGVVAALTKPVSADEANPMLIVPAPDEDSGMIGMPNPFVTYHSMADAVKAAGFSMKVPERINGYSIDIIQAVENSLIQVIYQKDSSQLYVRKAVGNDDISGDYNKYDEVKKIKVKGMNIKLKGTNGMVNTAVWTNKGYSYSIYCEKGISRAKAEKLIQKVG